MQNQHKYVLLCYFVFHFPLVAMEQSWLLSLSDMQKHAKEFDKDNNYLFQTITINTIRRILKPLWATNYINNMLIKGKNKNNEDVIYSTWGSFTNWYTTYIKERLTNFDKSRHNEMAQQIVSRVNVLHEYNSNQNPLILEMVDNDALSVALLSLYIRCGGDVQKKDIYENNALHRLCFLDMDFFSKVSIEALDRCLQIRLQKAAILIAHRIDFLVKNKYDLSPLDAVIIMKNLFLDNVNHNEVNTIISNYYRSFDLMIKKDAKST